MQVHVPLVAVSLFWVEGWGGWVGAGVACSVSHMDGPVTRWLTLLSSQRTPFAVLPWAHRS